MNSKDLKSFLDEKVILYNNKDKINMEIDKEIEI